MTSFRITLRVGALAVALLALSIAGAGWMMLDGVERIDDAGVASPETFETLRRTVAVTESTTATVADALDDLEGLVSTLSSSAETTASFVGETAEITATRIPESLGAIERAMPGLIDAAAVIDDSLSTLTLLGVDYQPEVPFDEALRDVHASLDGLQEDVAAQGLTLQRLVPEIETVHGTASDLTSRVQETRTHLRTAEAVLGEYDAILDSAESTIGSATGSALRFGPWARGLLVVLALSGLLLAGTMWQLAGTPYEKV